MKKRFVENMKRCMWDSRWSRRYLSYSTDRWGAAGWMRRGLSRRPGWPRRLEERETRPARKTLRQGQQTDRQRHGERKKEWNKAKKSNSNGKDGRKMGEEGEDRKRREKKQLTAEERKWKGKMKNGGRRRDKLRTLERKESSRKEIKKRRKEEIWQLTSHIHPNTVKVQIRSWNERREKNTRERGCILFLFGKRHWEGRGELRLALRINVQNRRQEVPNEVCSLASWWEKEGEAEEIRTEPEVRRKNHRLEFREVKELEKSHHTRQTVRVVVTERGRTLSGRYWACVWEESGRLCPKRWHLMQGHLAKQANILHHFSIYYTRYVLSHNMSVTVHCWKYTADNKITSTCSWVPWNDDVLVLVSALRIS